MTPLRPPLRPVSLANRYFGYIVTVILTGYAKADLGKEIKDALLNNENSNGNNLINITELQNWVKKKKNQILMKQMKDQLQVGMWIVVKERDI